MARYTDAKFLARLAGNLGDFPAAGIDDGVTYLLEQAALALGAQNTTVAVCLRDPGSEGPSLAGWRPVWDVRHGADSAHQASVFRDWYLDSRHHPDDPMLAGLARTAGAVRSLRRRDLVSDDEWLDSPVQELFDALSVHDRLVLGIPAGHNTEVFVTAYRRRAERVFSDADREFAAHVAAAVLPFTRRMTLTHGFGEGLTPLTPRERDVLKALLTGRSEKTIAGDLGLTPRSLHQHVVAVYRKLDVASRPQLMALFLGGPA